jgi:phenylalanyl-tRNA synthetase alpha subunit
MSEFRETCEEYPHGALLILENSKELREKRFEQILERGQKAGLSKGYNQGLEKALETNTRGYFKRSRNQGRQIAQRTDRQRIINESARKGFNKGREEAEAQIESRYLNENMKQILIVDNDKEESNTKDTTVELDKSKSRENGIKRMEAIAEHWKQICIRCGIQVTIT